MKKVHENTNAILPSLGSCLTAKDNFSHKNEERGEGKVGLRQGEKKEGGRKEGWKEGKSVLSWLHGLVTSAAAEISLLTRVQCLVLLLAT